jgi:hypothetical protein
MSVLVRLALLATTVSALALATPTAAPAQSLGSNGLRSTTSDDDIRASRFRAPRTTPGTTQRTGSQTANGASTIGGNAVTGQPQGEPETGAPGSGAGTTGFISGRRPTRTDTGAQSGGRQTQRGLTPAAPRTPNATGPQRTIGPDGQVLQPNARRRRPPETDPFEATGLRLGTLTIRPSVEFLGGYDTNPGRTADGRGSSVWRVDPAVTWQSDWTRHGWTGDLRGSFARFPSTPTLDRPDINGTTALRLDVGPRTRIDIEGRLRLSQEDPGSPNIDATVAEAPDLRRTGTTVGLTHQFNRLEATLRGTFDRTTYGDSLLTNNTTVSNADRAFNQTGASLRLGYEVSPGVRPFVEAGLDRRRFDLPVDSGGVARGSDGMTLRGGSTFEISRLLTGEASLGLVTRDYDDPTLPRLRGTLLDASLVWSATPLTRVTFTARTAVEDSTSPGVSGILRRDIGVAVEHAFRRWLTGTASLTAGFDDFRGTDQDERRLNATLGLTYRASRTVSVRGEFRQDWLTSTAPGRDYTASAILVGLRLQR